MLAPTNTDALNCPITGELFRDPVIGQDGHTYERNAITEWLQKNGTSPITREPMSIESLRPNHTIKKLIDEFQLLLTEKHFIFKLNVDIKKADRRPIFQAPGKTIHRGEWIVKRGPPVVLIKIEGAKARREASYYVQLGSHPHIVHTYGMVENDTNALMLVQEYANEGDLALLLKDNEFRPSELVLIEIFLQIIDAMIYLANYDIVHGDLACRNVLVFRFNDANTQENLVKLTDFGLTRASSLYAVAGNTQATTMTLIPVRYVAPEILQSAGKSNYSEKSDVYSMGILMWEGCSQGQLPYGETDDENDVRRYKLKGNLLNKPENCNDALWNIIVSCWHELPEKRPTFKMLQQSLTELKTQLVVNFNVEQNKNTQNSSTNTAQNINQNQFQVPSTTEPSAVPKSDTFSTNFLPNEPLTITKIECEQCQQHLPHVDISIHDQNLTELDLSMKSITDNGIQHLVTILPNNTKLITLDLSYNQIGQRGVSLLSRVLRTNQTLTTLNLANNKIDDVGVQYLAEAITLHQMGPNLNLLRGAITDKVAQLLRSTIQTNQTLTTLNLSGNNISPEGAKYLANALGTNQTLTTLDLYYNQIGDIGTQYLADTLKKNKVLTTLNLGRNQIGDTGAQYLAKALLINQTLTTLNLERNQIGDVGEQALAEAQQENKTLVTLELRGNIIGDAGERQIFDVLQFNEILTKLSAN